VARLADGLRHLILHKADGVGNGGGRCQGAAAEPTRSVHRVQMTHAATPWKAFTLQAGQSPFGKLMTGFSRE